MIGSGPAQTSHQGEGVRKPSAGVITVALPARNTLRLAMGPVKVHWEHPRLVGDTSCSSGGRPTHVKDLRC